MSTATSTPSCLPGNPVQRKPRFVRPEQVLRDLFELLEDYGPAWYTEDLHRRASAALDQVCETEFREVFTLLEDYAPVWYTEEHHRRASAALENLRD